MPKVTPLRRMASTYSFCPSVLGRICLPRYVVTITSVNASARGFSSPSRASRTAYRTSARHPAAPLLDGRQPVEKPNYPADLVLLALDDHLVAPGHEGNVKALFDEAQVRVVQPE